MFVHMQNMTMAFIRLGVVEVQRKLMQYSFPIESLGDLAIE